MMRRGNPGHDEQLKNKENEDITVEDLLLEKHDPPDVKQDKSDMLSIKQEAEPVTPSIKEEQQEEEIPKFPMTVRVKSDEDEGPSEESRAAKLASGSLFRHLPSKDITVDLHPEKPDPPDVKQEESDMPSIKQGAEPVIPSIKEEEQEDEIPKFPMTVSVKSDEDEGPSEARRAAKLASSSLFQHLPTKAITVDLHPEKPNPPDVEQEELDMPPIKQEAEALTPSIEEQEDEIPEFPMTVIVKSDEDEGPSGESGAVKLASSSLFQHLPTKVPAIGTS
ncbi:uncharacterized protein LOC130921365 isoform X3 [Corythoichthys intestinalis]|uniref:uncharacterized protein LOC130921365 isoform X3 n=1 Tax=Corythoichthys intestinalis TaxID=161448 RepID=UPI0025A4CF66|nr:uncharacterized protein LOC130921365 isoform X3 [Corythoichthys intestinalis]